MTFDLTLMDSHFLPHIGCDIKLEIKHGEGILIKGENGLGKTTLLNRLFECQKNKVSSAILEQKAFDFFYDRSLKEIKYLLVKNGGLLLDRELFLRLWKSFGPEEKENRLISNLSGGELQSLKLCIALSKRADLFFIDEPLQSLDGNRRMMVMNLLAELRARGAALVVVEHESALFSSKEWIMANLYTDQGSLKAEVSWST
jgi:ABC-type Mn2+/Zn2+ transport system ATPase subunit